MWVVENQGTLPSVPVALLLIFLKAVARVCKHHLSQGDLVHTGFPPARVCGHRKKLALFV